MDKDWADQAARDIWEDFSDRRGVGDALDSVDEEIAEEMVDTMANIIRKAAP